MWILSELRFLGSAQTRIQSANFVLFPSAELFQTNTFMYNYEDFGEWVRWEREARIILTTGNVLLLWNQISHNAICYSLNIEDSLSPGRQERWRKWSPCNQVDTNHKSKSPHVVFFLSFFSPIRSRCYYTLFNVSKLLLITSVICILISSSSEEEAANKILINTVDGPSCVLTSWLVFGKFLWACNPSGQYYEGICQW